jgi:hypothetical protein
MSWALERGGEVLFIATLDFASNPTLLAFLSVHIVALHL